MDKKCVSCHRSTEYAGPKDMSYNKLRPYTFYFGHGIQNRTHGGSRTRPGKFSKQDLRTIIMWLDMNSNELSAYKKKHEQRAGEIVWPDFDVDPDNITGTEL